MIVVAHLRAHGDAINWMGHVSIKDDPASQEIARAAIDVIASTMDMREGDLLRIMFAPDPK
jgi:hypothetical protein